MSSRCLRFQLIACIGVFYYPLFSRNTTSSPPVSFSRTSIVRQGSGHIFANEIRFDRQFAMAAIDQHGQLNPRGPAKIVQRIHRGARRASAEQHVIDQHDRFPGDVERHLGGMNCRGDAAGRDRPGAC